MGEARHQPRARRVPTPGEELDERVPAAVTEGSSSLMDLQRSAGNAAVVSMLAAADPEPAMIARAPLPGLLRADLGLVQRGSKQRKAKAAKKAAAAAASASTTTAESESTETEGSETDSGETDTGEIEDGETEGSETESAETTTTTTTASTGSTGSSPAPSQAPPPDPKIAILKGVIGDGPYGRMLAELGSDAAVVKYGEDCGAQRLKYLIETQRLTAAVLKHYGAAMLKDFVGVGDAAWSHLTTAKLNSQGAISGGHDDAVFNTFVASVHYRVTSTAGRGEIFKVWYSDDNGDPVGTKTLIRGLVGKKATWVGYFNTALWKAIREKTLTAGTCYVSDADGYRYGLYWRSGASEVDTIYMA